MPLIKVETSAQLDKAKTESLALALSKTIAKALGKPESYVQSIVEDGAAIAFAGKTDAPSAYVLVRGIGGFSPQVNKSASKAICATLEQEAGIEPGRVYINFEDIPASDWGWNGGTFG